MLGCKVQNKGRGVRLKWLDFREELEDSSDSKKVVRVMV
jgi:hypothetical protein